MNRPRRQGSAAWRAVTCAGLGAAAWLGIEAHEAHQQIDDIPDRAIIAERSAQFAHILGVSDDETLAGLRRIVAANRDYLPAAEHARDRNRNVLGAIGSLGLAYCAAAMAREPEDETTEPTHGAMLDGLNPT